MAKIVFSNFGQTILASPVGPSDTSITVRPGDGGKFPSPTGGDYFVIVITDDATKENHEVMHGTARSGDTITVVRGQEGTAAQNWLVGDIVQCANTAGTMSALYQQEMINTLLQTVIYPVGSVYISATSTTNPNTILGFGTWTAVAGRALVGYDVTQSEFDSLLEEGGSKTHTLTISEMPEHSHTFLGVTGGGDPGGGGFGGGSVNTGPAGSGDAHNNLQPYLVMAIWRRTA